MRYRFPCLAKIGETGPSLSITSAATGLVAQEFLDLLELCLTNVQVLPRTLGIVRLNRLLCLIEVDLHQLLRRGDVSAQIHSLRTHRATQAIESVGNGIRTARSLVHVVLEFFEIGLGSAV